MEQNYTQTAKGSPFPLGATFKGNGFNFAVYSENPVDKLILAPLHSPKDITTYPISDKINKTGFIWHIFVPTDELELLYAFSSNNTLLIDPYAKLIKAGSAWGKNNWAEKKYKSSPLALAFAQEEFDWEDDTTPRIPCEDLVIYEMHLRGFTQSPSSHVAHPGTCKGLIEKIPYLKQLGINAVEFLPLLEFDETDNPNINPITKKKLFNYWATPL